MPSVWSWPIVFIWMALPGNLVRTQEIVAAQLDEPRFTSSWQSWGPMTGLFRPVGSAEEPKTIYLQQKKSILSMFGAAPPRPRHASAKPRMTTETPKLAVQLARLNDNARLICLASLEQSPLCRTLRDKSDSWKRMMERNAAPTFARSPPHRCRHFTPCRRTTATPSKQRQRLGYLYTR